jgi:hypothetical protein
LLRYSEQFRGRAPKRKRKREDILKAQIAFASLNATDVRTMESSVICKLFLRKVQAEASLSHRKTKGPRV